MKKCILFIVLVTIIMACDDNVERVKHMDFKSGKIVALEDCAHELKKAVVVQVFESDEAALRQNLLRDTATIDGVYYDDLIRLYISQGLFSKLRVGSLIGSTFDPASSVQCKSSVYNLHNYVAFDDKTGLNSF